MQKAMGMPAYYAIEFLERFDKMSMHEQDKVIIHELMHIPKTFGGGFRQHDYVCEQNVELMYAKFAELRVRKPLDSSKKNLADDFGQVSQVTKKLGFEKQTRILKFPFWR
jgi:predicted metallopeptidase